VSIAITVLCFVAACHVDDRTVTTAASNDPDDGTVGKEPPDTVGEDNDPTFPPTCAEVICQPDIREANCLGLVWDDGNWDDECWG
jgi:hypothetical protein